MFVIPRSSLKMQLYAGFLACCLFVLVRPLVRPVEASHETNSRAATGLSAPASAGIREIALTTKDLVYDPVGQRIYASLPSSAPNGNSLVQIDPVGGTVGTPVPLGSEPGKLAISDNSQYIYASLDGAAAVRRFDIASQTAGLQFTLGSDPTWGNFFVDDIEVMPGQPTTVAVARKREGFTPRGMGVAIYDNGATRLNTTATLTANVIEFGSSPTILYGFVNEGSPPPFNTMTINGSGATVSSTLFNYITGSGTDIRFAGGLIYATSGQVLNPTTGALLGRYAGITSGLVVPDPANNRVYFLTGSPSSTLTLKAFNLNTFMPTGTLSIPGVSGTPGSFIKWGSDGLAFRTTGNQIFLLSIADLVPVSQTATPTPVQVANGILRLPLVSSDLVYDSNTQKIYASLPSSTSTFGNSLAPIDPQTGKMGNVAPIGSEPKRLAISDNGQYIYAELSSAASVRKFDIPSQSPQIQFPLGTASGNSGPMLLRDMAVMPGSPSSVAVSRLAGGNEVLTVFDDGIQRGINVFCGSAIEAASPTTVYSFENGYFSKFTLSAAGFANVSPTSFITGFGDIRYDNGRIYSADGGVYDPEAQTLIGTIAGDAGLVVPDSAGARIYYLTGLGSSTLTLKSFDSTTLAQTGVLTISGIAGTPSSFIKAGPGTLAFRTSDQVYFVAVSAMTPMTAIPTPTSVAAGVIQLPVMANDLVFDPTTQKVYASLPSGAGGFGNSLAPIDPLTGNMSTPIFMGSEPKKLAIANNNQFVYAGLDGVGGVRRFDLGSQTAGLQFTLGNQFGGRLFVDDMAALPDNANAVAISRRTANTSPRHQGVVIYDDNTPRAKTTDGATLNEAIEFSANPSKLYGYNNESTEFGIHKLIVNSSGVTVASTLSTAIQGFGVDIKYSNGNLYSSTGHAVNAETGANLGTFPGVNTFAFVPDATVRRVYYITGTGVATTIQAFDQDTFSSVGSLIVPGVVGTATKMIRWGAHGLAFTTSGNQIFFIETDLVPSPSKIATTTTLSSSLNPAVSGQSVTFTATVSSSAGPASGTVQFQDGGVNLGLPQQLNGGVATLSNATIGVGLRTITAEYSGGGNLLISAASLAQSVLPLLSMNDVSANEGQGATNLITFSVNLSAASNQTVTVNYATADGTATAGSDYVATSGTLTFNPGETTKFITINIQSDQSFEADETFLVNLTSTTNASLTRPQATGTIRNDDAEGGFLNFTQGSYGVSENTGFVTVKIIRSNDTTRAATVDYATSDTGASAQCGTSNGLASSRCDFTAAFGTLRFAPGETEKTFVILVNRDSYNEASESFGIGLSNLKGGAIMVGSSTALGVIFNSSPPPPANIIDDARAFVRQHYHDFLNREPDQAGVDFWTNEITSCGSDAQCIEVKRINVSASFFLSIEFKETGYMIERLYKTAYGDAIGNSTLSNAHQLSAPLVRLNELLADTQQISQGVIVGQGNWEQQIETNKQSFVADFVQRSRFTTAFPTSMSAAQFVDALNANAGNQLSQTERDQLVNDLSTTAKTRAQVLRAIAEHPKLIEAERSRAFVLMQYFGYLRRNPDDAPEVGLDHTGYDFWLTKLNGADDNFFDAEMVKAFLSSIEYRQRFGP
jgi:Calx-beta domain/Domain of unknown function (DUF4214)